MQPGEQASIMSEKSKAANKKTRCKINNDLPENDQKEN